MQNNPHRHVCHLHRHQPKPGTISLCTIQPSAVWHALREQGTLLVNPDHPDFIESLESSRDAYEWLRGQMAKRIPGYSGHYPWWAYEHFLDLRFYRWHSPRQGQRLVRLELEIPREQVLLSGYAAWHCVLNRWYLPQAVKWEEYEQELDAWEAEASHGGVARYRNRPLAEPWEAQMRASWDGVFNVDERRSTETIQATFERLELEQVVKATEFTSMPGKRS